MKAFAYPKERHRRGSDPGPYSTYHSYKPHLRREFLGRCVYCQIRDSMNREALFAVEHYRPQSLFPHLATQWSNLYYACATCNRAKSSFVPKGKRAKIDFVPHPCEHVMFEHLRYRGPTVVHHSKTGRFAIELLDLNAPTSIKFRGFYEETLEYAQTQLAGARKLVGQIESAIVGTEGARLTQLQSSLRRARLNCDKAQEYFDIVAGPFGLS